MKFFLGKLCSRILVNGDNNPIRYRNVYYIKKLVVPATLFAWLSKTETRRLESTIHTVLHDDVIYAQRYLSNMECQH